jgi:uncharacterized protein (TIGR02271 family)
MHTTFDQQIQQGDDVYGSDGEKIGSIAAVAVSHFVIEKGFIFTTDIYVPTSAIAGIDEDGVRLSMTKDQVENQDWSEAPSDDGTDLDTSNAEGGYGADVIDDRTASAGTAMGGTTTDADRIERAEEHLTVDKRAEQAGAVQVGKHVVEERQAVDVPVTREEVTLERHAVDRPVGSGDVFADEAIEVPVYEERVETGKEARVVEELEVGKTATTDTAHVEDTVRREEFDIDATTKDDIDSTGTSGTSGTGR